jgi:hypothetical protein
MSIRIPSKSDKLTSPIRDALRILSWIAYKEDNKESELKGLDAYKAFDEEWKTHEIQTMNLSQLDKLIKPLEYSHRRFPNDANATASRACAIEVLRSS